MRKALLLPLLALIFALAWGEEGGSTTRPVPGAAPADPMSASLQAETASPYSVRFHFDWPRRILVIDVSLDLKKAGLALPEGRLTAERMVKRDLPGLAKDAFFAIPLDSEGTIGDQVLAGGLDVEAILGLVDSLKNIDDAMSSDLLSLRSKWELPLSEATALFVTWKRPSPLPSPLGWSASRPYTGIVIYADKPLPVYGERGVSESLRPGLLPRVFDANMGVVTNRWVVDPKVLVEQGPLGYIASPSTDDEARIGDNPLLIRATGLFGLTRTDLIIAQADAARILADPANRDLVVQGRILVVVPRETGSRSGG